MENSKKADEPEMLLMKDVTRRLRITHSTLQRMIDNGEIVAYEISGNWRIPVAEFEAYLERKRNVPAMIPNEKVAV